MAGNWAVYPYNHSNEDPPPEPTKTNRVRLESGDIAADLAAMTMQHSDMSLYNNKQCKLGEDPLCADVDPEALWQRIQGSKKSISALLMDQSYFAGPGNIYRAEILFKAGVHPDVLGRALERSQFDRVWAHTVALLLRGFETGSTLTVDPSEAKALGRSRLYIYNTSRCPRCSTHIQT